MRIFRLLTFRLALPLSIGWLLSCNSPDAFDCVKTAGSTETVVQPVPSFSSLMVYDNIDVYLTNDTSSVITIEGGKNLIPKISWEKTGDTLILRNRNKCNWARSYESKVKVTMGVSRLNVITTQSFGVIQSTEQLQINSLSIYNLEADGNMTLDMQASSFYFYTNCSPAVTLTGTVNSFGVWSREFGKINAQGLVAQSCDIRNASANDISVYPVQKLVARIEQSGNIIYYNTPETIEPYISGTGKLIRE